MNEILSRDTPRLARPEVANGEYLLRCGQPRCKGVVATVEYVRFDRTGKRTTLDNSRIVYINGGELRAEKFNGLPFYAPTHRHVNRSEHGKELQRGLYRAAEIAKAMPNTPGYEDVPPELTQAIIQRNLSLKAQYRHDNEQPRACPTLTLADLRRGPVVVKCPHEGCICKTLINLAVCLEHFPQND